MDAISASLMIKALDGLSARAVATAQNIANAGTANYRPLRVSFEEALREAARQGPDVIRNVRPKFEHVQPSAVASDMRLDLELATASSTALRYSALIEILNRQTQIQALAFSGNS
jgi:flagellar basal-body rod protein FlgB